MSLLACHAAISPRKDATCVQCGQSVVTAAVAAEPGALLGEITLQRPHPFSGDPRSCRSLGCIAGSPQLGIEHQTCSNACNYWAGPLAGSASVLGPGWTCQVISSTKLRYHIFISLRLRREGLGCDLSSLTNSTSIPVGSCSRRLFLDWASYLVAIPSCILAHVPADESLCQLTLCEKEGLGADNLDISTHPSPYRGFIL